MRDECLSGNLILVAHSLGSVIALDGLLNFETFSRFDRITLVTCGSPLKRFFFSFFPERYFPSKATIAAMQVAAAHSEFRWINLYRPLDYVGSRLGLDKKLWLFEAAITQRRQLHSGYFSDVSVMRALSVAMQQTSYTKAESPRRTTINFLTPKLQLWQTRFFRSFGLRVLILLMAALPLYLFADNFLGQGRAIRRAKAAQAEGVSRAGKPLVASFRCVSRLQRVGEMAFVEFYDVVITYTYLGRNYEWKDSEREGVFGGKAVADPNSEDYWHFDWGKLQSPEMSACFQSGGAQFRIAVLSSDPEKFVALHLPPHQSHQMLSGISMLELQTLFSITIIAFGLGVMNYKLIGRFVGLATLSSEIANVTESG